MKGLCPGSEVKPDWTASQWRQLVSSQYLPSPTLFGSVLNKCVSLGPKLAGLGFHANDAAVNSEVSVALAMDEKC